MEKRYLEGESLPLIQEDDVLAGYSSTDIPAEYVKARLSAASW
jgi:hypothetical protein